MINEYDHVKIKKTGRTGIVVDIRKVNGSFYLVEDDISNEIFDCTEDDLEKIE